MKGLTILQIITTITAILMIAAMLIVAILFFAEEFVTSPNERAESNNECSNSIVDNTTIKSAEKKNYYNITNEERELLAKIVYLESSICSLNTQNDVCSVIFNRLESGKWKKDMNSDGKITLYDIIYYPCAFSPVLEGKMDSCVPDANAYKAVDYVVKNGPTIPTYVRYFRSDRHFTEWYDEGYIGYRSRDNMYFGYFEGWEQGQW